METTTETTIKPINPLLLRVYRTFFNAPSIVLIGSNIPKGATPWKTGKTDWALKISEDILRLGFIDKVASNIDTSGTYKYIANLQSLKFWLHGDSETKLYILDEANVHLPSRRAMSTKSVDIISLYPEISKARARLIVVGQNLDDLDSTLRKTGWVRGRFLKQDLKTVYTFLGNKRIVFHNVPRTSITFDPYKTAPFTLEPTNVGIDDEELSKFYKYCSGTPARDLDFNSHNTKAVNDWARKMGLRLLKERYG